MSADVLRGCVEPRLFTRPRGPLTPESTYGYEVIDFARDICGIELLEWQRFWLIHALEKNPDGSFRFRRVVTIVARQNGKSFLLTVFALWMMVKFPGSTVLGVAQLATTALESWEGTIQLAEDAPTLSAQATAKGSVRRANGSARFKLGRSRYMTAAANRRAGRGLSINALILDELREMRNWDAYSALAPTISAQRMGIIVAITNAGDDQAVVLNSLREAALADVEDGIALMEWSAEEGADMASRGAWAQANPGLGVTVQEADLRIALASEPPHVFRTERLNQRVSSRDEAIDLAAWGASADPDGSMGGFRERVALCLDVSPDLTSITLAAAAKTDEGRVRVQLVASWEDTNAMRADLPDLLARINPAVFGWMPNGPAAALAAELKAAPRTEAIKDVAAACMEFAEFVSAGRVLHPNDPRLNAQVSRAGKKESGSGWRFIRAGSTHVDAVFAAAGAVHLARGMTAKKGKPRILVANAA